MMRQTGDYLPTVLEMFRTFWTHPFFNQEGNSGMRVIAELTDSFFGQATITSDFLLVNPPTEGTVSINGNPLFSDGEIYTLTNVDELTDGNGIGTFSYLWYVSIDGGN